MTPVELPQGLADMPPGPALGALLAGVDPSRIANADTVTMLTARYRQLAHEQAALLEALVEVARSDPDNLPGARRLPAVGEWAGGEIAAALTLTAVAADRELTNSPSPTQWSPGYRRCTPPCPPGSWTGPKPGCSPTTSPTYPQTRPTRSAPHSSQRHQD
jgi:hypothetical protein